MSLKVKIENFKNKLKYKLLLKQMKPEIIGFKNGQGDYV